MFLASKSLECNAHETRHSSFALLGRAHQRTRACSQLCTYWQCQSPYQRRDGPTVAVALLHFGWYAKYLTYYPPFRLEDGAESLPRCMANIPGWCATDGVEAFHLSEFRQGYTRCEFDGPFEFFRLTDLAPPGLCSHFQHRTFSSHHSRWIPTRPRGKGKSH